MSKKWCISTLVILLTLLGVVSQQQITVPNQEIVLQFADVAVTSNDAQNTIATVKKQLLSLGAENIRVAEEEGGLRITYFSTSDISDIKKLLSEDVDFNFNSASENPFQFPEEDNSVSYNLDVYEISNGSDLSDLDGKLVLEVKSENERFFNPNVFSSVKTIDTKEKNKEVKVALKINRHIAIAIDNNSHNIPEVRAGPNC